MAKVTILLAPREVMREFFFDKNKLQLVRDNLSNYSIGGTYEWPIVGVGVVPDAFGLTNNPGRQIEREKKYGRARSVSSGDIVDVDGVKYVCMSFGWEIL